MLHAGVQYGRKPDAAIEREQILEVFETNLVASRIMMCEAALVAFPVPSLWSKGLL